MLILDKTAELVFFVLFYWFFQTYSRRISLKVIQVDGNALFMTHAAVNVVIPFELLRLRAKCTHRKF